LVLAEGATDKGRAVDSPHLREGVRRRGCQSCRSRHVLLSARSTACSFCFTGPRSFEVVFLGGFLSDTHAPASRSMVAGGSVRGKVASGRSLSPCHATAVAPHTSFVQKRAAEAGGRGSDSGVQGQARGGRCQVAQFARRRRIGGRVVGTRFGHCERGSAWAVRRIVFLVDVGGLFAFFYCVAAVMGERIGEGLHFSSASTNSSKSVSADASSSATEAGRKLE
jgi:hypothetical protein